MTTDEPGREHAQSHYFDATQTSDAKSRDFVVTGPWGELHMSAESAVFSSRGLDKGTEVLLRHVSERGLGDVPPGSLVCDVGCGSGVIACVAAAMLPASTIHAVDVNSRARTLTERNARRNGLANVLVRDDPEPEPGATYRLILSNPPIRIGKQRLHDLLLVWLAHLDDNGLALIVVSKNLGADSLRDWLESEGYPTDKRSSSKGFRVLEIRRTAHNTQNINHPHGQ